MVLAIPGGWGLFSQLQSVILHATNPKPSDCLPQCVHDQLDDIRWIANSLNAQPTCWAKIVDSSPAFIGTVDASGLGMGGTWISCTQAAPLLWRHRFDATISDRLVSTENLTGSLTNSDLEQLALMCHPDILTDNHDVREETICTLSDNMAAISRERHLHISAISPPSTNALDVTAYGSTTFWAHSMSWRTTYRVAGICLTHNFLLTLMLTTHRTYRGNSVRCDQR
jgi:hypothetical protein